jgi:hypothetical protein
VAIRRSTSVPLSRIPITKKSRRWRVRIPADAGTSAVALVINRWSTTCEQWRLLVRMWRPPW